MYGRPPCFLCVRRPLEQVDFSFRDSFSLVLVQGKSDWFMLDRLVSLVIRVGVLLFKGDYRGSSW